MVVKFRKRVLKNVGIVSGILLTIFICLVLLIDHYVSRSVYQRLYNESYRIPRVRVGLLLGTSKYLSNGQANLYYQYRIDAAVMLFRTGKIRYILVSGDNAHRSYDEPQMMRNDLIELGVPKEKIYLDFAGFRTLDSVVRAKEIFGQDSLIIISQKFHNERALYLAKKFGIEAYAFNAKDVDRYYGFKTMVREKLARIKMIIDIIVGTQPKFLGEKIEIR